jgi:hypothetical protein
MMDFVKQFKDIINNGEVQKRAKFYMDCGANDPRFINYFGVNYNRGNIISVKLYFSFLEQPPELIFDQLKLSSEHRQLIKDYWKPSKSFDYTHQGLTFGLKCYLTDEGVIINDYLHFRTKEFVLGFPEKIDLTAEDKQNFPGVCIEFHEKQNELKNYYYITSEINKQKLINMFAINNVAVEDIFSIEYTESNIESKVNLTFNNSEGMREYFNDLNCDGINELNKYFFDNHKLYYFAPGMRLNSNVNALYYISKDAFENLIYLQTLQLFIK